MDESNRIVITSKIRQSIIEKIDFHLNVLEFAIVKLYINYQNSQIWENTNLEGYLVLVNDSYSQALKLQIFDFVNFNKEFEIELYSNIEDGYEILRDTFHSIEFQTFFIGLNFSDKTHAEKFKNKLYFFNKLKTLDKYFTTYIPDQEKTILSSESNKNLTVVNVKTLNNNYKNSSDKSIINLDTSIKINGELNFKLNKKIDLIERNDIKFKQVNRILELEIQKNILDQTKFPIITPEIETGESQFLYEKYIILKQLYFENIQSFYKELKKKYDGISLKDESRDSESVLQVEDEFLLNSKNGEHKNENEEFIAYNLNKRNTIKIRSKSYLKSINEQILKNQNIDKSLLGNKDIYKNIENNNFDFSKDLIKNNIHSNEKNNINSNIFNNNKKFHSSSNLSLMNEDKNNRGLKNETNNNDLKIKANTQINNLNDNLINRFSNNKILNQVISQKRAMAYQDNDENTSSSKLSDFD